MTDAGREHLADWAKALAALEKATMQLIIDELAELMPGLKATEDQAAAALREACTALGKPEQLLADLDAEVGRVTGQCAEWQGKLSSLRAEDRVEARVRFQAWSDELDKLKAQRDQAERDLEPYYAARNKARADLELVNGALRGLAYAMAMPYESRVGQATKAYINHRQPRLTYVLLAGDRSHPEWECAVTELEELQRVVEQTPAEAAAMMTAAMADASATIDPGPNAADIMAQTDAEMANLALQKSPTRIDDYRSGPAVPRNERVESYRQVPTLRDMGLR